MSRIRRASVQNVCLSDGGLLTDYLREIARYPLLTIEEERQMAASAQAGDQAARDRFITCNLRLVVPIARCYQPMFSMCPMDVIQEGNTGLIRALDTFDRVHRFSTHATWWVRQSIGRALPRLRKTALYVPEYKEQQATRLKKLLQHGDQSPEDLAKALHLSREAVDELLAVVLPERAGCLSLEELFRSEQTGDYAERHVQGSDLVLPGPCPQAQVKALLGHLSPREREAVEYYFGLEDQTQEASITAVARRMGCSRQRVHQLKTRAIARLIALSQEANTADGMLD